MAEYQGMRVEISEDPHREPIPATELADFLRYFRAAYVAVLMTHSVGNQATDIGSYENVDRPLADDLARMVGKAGPYHGMQFLRLTARHVPVDVGIARISYNSPLQMVLTGIPVALTAAVILSGGEFRLDGIVRVKLPPLGTGIAKLREAFGMKPRRPRQKHKR